MDKPLGKNDLVILICNKLQISVTGDIIKNVADFVENFEKIKKELEECKIALDLITPLKNKK